jgi:hypothetical protein
MRDMMHHMSLPFPARLGGVTARAHAAKPTGTTKTVTKTV